MQRPATVFLDPDDNSPTLEERRLWEAFVKQHRQLIDNQFIVKGKPGKVYQVEIQELDRSINTIDVSFVSGFTFQTTVQPRIPAPRARKIVVIDPTADTITPEVEKILREVLTGRKKEFLAGELLKRTRDTDYVLSSDYRLGWYERTTGKAGIRFGVLGKKKGNGAFASVFKMQGVLRLNADSILYKAHPKPSAENVAAQNIKPRWVLKRQKIEEENRMAGRAAVRAEHEALKLTGSRVRALTFFMTDEGMVSYIFEERAEGQSLRERLYTDEDKKAPLDFLEALRLCEQSAEAYLKQFVENAHLHLDLKPDNIMVSAKGAKIVDPGCAQKVEDTSVYFKGTIGHLAPEIYATHLGESEARASAELDVFALGITCAQVLGTLDIDKFDAAKRHDMQVLFGEREGELKFYNAGLSGDLSQHFITLFEGLDNVDEEDKQTVEQFVLSMISPDPVKRPEPQQVPRFFQDVRQSIENRCAKRKLESQQHQFIQTMLDDIKTLDGRVTSFFGFGGAVRFIADTDADEKKGRNYRLPNGAAKIVDAIKAFKRGDIDFNVLIARSDDSVDQSLFAHSWYNAQKKPVKDFYSKISESIEGKTWLPTQSRVRNP